MRPQAARQAAADAFGSAMRCQPILDRAYEGNKTRQLALELGFSPLVPALSTRVDFSTYSKTSYRRRNAVERLFRRLKGLRRIFSRFGKLDVVFFMAFLWFVLIAEALR